MRRANKKKAAAMKKAQGPRTWAEHFRNRSAVMPDFGVSLLGSHTAHELSDLLAAKKVSVDDFAAHVQKLGYRTDPPFMAWQDKWVDFLVDWSPFYDSAMATIASDKASFLGWDYTYEEDLWQKALKILEPTGLGSSRLVALMLQMQAIPNTPPIVFRPVPQPSAPDLQGNVFVALDKEAAAMPQIVKAGVGLAAPGLVPQNKDTGSYDPMAFVKKYWKPVAVVAVVAVVGLTVVGKVASKVLLPI